MDVKVLLSKYGSEARISAMEQNVMEVVQTRRTHWGWLRFFPNHSTPESADHAVEAIKSGTRFIGTSKESSGVSK